MAANGSGARQNSTRRDQQQRADDPFERLSSMSMLEVPSAEQHDRGDRERADRSRARGRCGSARPGPAQQRERDQDRIFGDPVEDVAARSGPAQMPPIMPPADIHI